jgi:hypothetical protein
MLERILYGADSKQIPQKLLQLCFVSRFKNSAIIICFSCCGNGFLIPVIVLQVYVSVHTVSSQQYFRLQLAMNLDNLKYRLQNQDQSCEFKEDFMFVKG